MHANGGTYLNDSAWFGFVDSCGVYQIFCEWDEKQVGYVTTNHMGRVYSRRYFN
jgi:hypothetical protein